MVENQKVLYLEYGGCRESLNAVVTNSRLSLQTKKNVIFIKYWSLYLYNTECNAVGLNSTENSLLAL